MDLFVNPYAIYEGDPEGRYYAYETGDALIIVIDVMGNTTTYPLSADEWILQNSNSMWKFIFVEHLDGGEQSPSDIPTAGQCPQPYHYGRGGLRATDDNKPTGVFKGEQAIIQTWMEQYNTSGGATFFLSGHDHVAIIPTEKPNPDGSGTDTYMVKGGQMGSTPAPWAESQIFKKEMDWDMDGIADYKSNTVGTEERGYFKITIHGKQSVRFVYIASDRSNPAINNTAILTKTIYAK